MKQKGAVVLGTTLTLVAAMALHGGVQAQGPPAPRIGPDVYGQMRWR